MIFARECYGIQFPPDVSLRCHLRKRCVTSVSLYDLRVPGGSRDGKSAVSHAQKHNPAGTTQGSECSWARGDHALPENAPINNLSLTMGYKFSIPGLKPRIWLWVNGKQPTGSESAGIGKLEAFRELLPADSPLGRGPAGKISGVLSIALPRRRNSIRAPTRS
jgi:hypothetical protein